MFNCKSTLYVHKFHITKNDCDYNLQKIFDIALFYYVILGTVMRNQTMERWKSQAREATYTTVA